MKFTKTFYDACIDDNRLDLLERWDYTRNNNPKSVWFHSKKDIYLNCPCRRHESSPYKPEHIFNKDHQSSLLQKCKKCNSFAQLGIDTYGSDFLSAYWDYDKNTVDPWVIQVQSNKKVWIKCQSKTYHPSYDATCASFYGGSRCPYCKGFKLVPQDSIAATNPEVIQLWSENNDITPYEVRPSSSKKVWFKCSRGKHEDYFRTVSDSRRYGFRCPECAKFMGLSSYQKKTAKELSIYEYEVLHEENCLLLPINAATGRVMKYDNMIPALMLVIEVHGAQHYRASTKFTASLSEDGRVAYFQKSRRRDKEKKEYAIVNGYSYLEIPYTAFADDTYKRMIRYAISIAEHKIFGKAKEPKAI